MSLIETTYQSLLKNIFHNGVWTQNRTGWDTRFVPAGMVQADLREGFPLMGLRKLSYKGGTAEAQGFLRGYTNAADFEALGCKFWSANANDPTKGSDTSPWLSSEHRLGHNDLGMIYGYFWRNWPTRAGGVIDQIEQLLKSITTDPTSRRHMVATWEPESVLNKMGALPPCHDSWTVTIDKRKKLMHLSWRQRSTDIILGTPTNVVCYAFIQMLLARLTGYTPGILTGHLDNVHYYENHTHAVPLLLERTSLGLPELIFNRDVPIGEIGQLPEGEWLKKIDNSHITMVNYKHHDAIPGLTMAV